MTSFLREDTWKDKYEKKNNEPRPESIVTYHYCDHYDSLVIDAHISGSF